MLHTEARRGRAARPRLWMGLARSESEIREAQKLRWKIFAEELGARLRSPEPGVDRDMVDPYCEHLVVRDEECGEVVGTYRLLTGAQARRLGGFYSDDEFDLTRLRHLQDRTVEVGRSCVHPGYRNGATIALLWAGIAQFMQRHRCEYLIGCASLGMADGGHTAASLYNRVRETSLSPIEYRVFPRCALPLDRLDATLPAELPPLVKGYIRCGAYVCGEPAWDPDFDTADLLMLLPLSRLDGRYARHFMTHVRFE